MEKSRVPFVIFIICCCGSILTFIGCQQENLVAQERQQEVTATTDCCGGFQEECIEYAQEEHTSILMVSLNTTCCNKVNLGEELKCYEVCREKENTTDYDYYCRDDCYKQFSDYRRYCYDESQGSHPDDEGFTALMIEHDCYLKPHIEKWNESKCVKTTLVRKL